MASAFVCFILSDSLLLVVSLITVVSFFIMLLLSGWCGDGRKALANAPGGRVR